MMKRIVFLMGLLLLPESVFSQEAGDWIFVGDISGKEDREVEGYWRIKDDKLWINKTYEDPIGFETFDDYIKEAKDKHIPFFLALTQGGEGKNAWLNMYEGKNLIKLCAEQLGKSGMLHYIASKHYPELSSKYPPANCRDPLTNNTITTLSLFFMGDDGNFILLDEDAADYLLEFGNLNVKVRGVDIDNINLREVDSNVEEADINFIYTVKQELSEAGKAQLFIGKLITPFSSELEEKKKELQELIKKRDQSWREKRFKEGNKLETKRMVLELQIYEIENKYKQITNPEMQKQQAQLWFSWAMKYLDPHSPEWQEAKKEYDMLVAPKQDQIPIQVQSALGISESLMHSLQSLTTTLRGLGNKLV